LARAASALSIGPGHGRSGWTLAYGRHEDHSPVYGYEATREAAMAAFAKSWRRE